MARFRPSYETLVCGIYGHVAPAASVARLGPEHGRLGLDVAPERRLSRCLRCDAWIEAPPPAAPARETLPPVVALEVPRRGRRLREALILRLIAVERAVHAVLFAMLAAALLWLDARLPALRAQASTLLDALLAALSQSGPNASRHFLTRQLARFLHLERHTVTLFALTAAAYAVVEGLEAVGLWRERRWAAYLTALATAGFLPFEIMELARGVSPLRVAALAANLAILAYLLVRERLFGIRGGARARSADTIDRQALFGDGGDGAAGPGPSA
jgi:uncharacterized membrane protein (DUF2068 family)